MAHTCQTENPPNHPDLSSRGRYRVRKYGAHYHFRVIYDALCADLYEIRSSVTETSSD